MSGYDVPDGFADIEGWLLHELYEHPQVKHATHTLFQQLEGVLRTEPSNRATINEIRTATQMEPLPAEAPVTEKHVEYSSVQWAVETLIESGWAKGDRKSGADGVYFAEIRLTSKGEAEAIRRKRKFRVVVDI
jgi:hypothetical protein